jgi:hypothetical protein
MTYRQQRLRSGFITATVGRKAQQKRRPIAPAQWLYYCDDLTEDNTSEHTT